MTRAQVSKVKEKLDSPNKLAVIPDADVCAGNGEYMCRKLHMIMIGSYFLLPFNFCWQTPPLLDTFLTCNWLHTSNVTLIL